MKGVLLDLVLWVFASPILLVEYLVRLSRWIRYWKVSYTTSFPCRNCGESISLVGIWQCGCRYVYKGHVLRTCPICSSLPRLVRCYACGLTTKLPEPCA
jgi:hypothetical protein